MRHMRFVPVVLALAVPLVPAVARAQTGAPIGVCPTGGGWAVDGYSSDNESAILVDQVYGNNNGLLCVKWPGNAPYPMLVDDVAAPAAQR
jgi:hypothetical protein